MFISKSRHGYYTGDGQQHSGRGQYLALFSWNAYKAFDELMASCSDCQTATAAYEQALHSHTLHEHKDLTRKCAVHAGEYSVPGPRYINGKEKLWAVVRQAALSQLGHFMMGSIRIGGKSITVSGPIGHDGLPLDLQDVPVSWRDRLVLVPEDVASAYWADKGHNDITGGTADVLRKWAISTQLGRSTNV